MDVWRCGLENAGDIFSYVSFRCYSSLVSKEQIPPGATLLGTLLSSDKTTISVMTGDRLAHPLLISLANIKMDYRSKGSHHAFQLLALLPIPKFTEKDKSLRGVFENRVIHECLDFILSPLKMAAKIGVMMNDARGFSRYCFTPLAAYIADTPEAAMLSGVCRKTSHLTLATYKEFGDPHQHTPRIGSDTLTKLQTLATSIDPTADIKAYVHAAKKLRLNGVHLPFWRDWPLADPSIFFPPEPLHHWHKQFWDHDVKWCIHVLGEHEIDFRFSVLQPHTGFRHFREGISKMKQVTGREHRNIQRYIVGVIAGKAPNDFVSAIRALMDFRYLAQAPVIDDHICTKIQAALNGFHVHKQSILDAGARTGKGNKPIENWYIPKLELMQSTVPNIKANGVAIQWSADVTEHAHIAVVKDPSRSGNNQRHEDTICRVLDREDKRLQFDLATSIRDVHSDIGMAMAWMCNDQEADSNEITDTQPIDTPSSHLNTVSRILKSYQVATNYFESASHASTATLFPPRIFFTNSTAFRLNRDPTFKKISIYDVSVKFGIPDLASALSHFLYRLGQDKKSVYTIGGRRPVSDVALPFCELEVWSSVRMQVKDYHHPDIVLPPETLNAAPPSTDWPLGRYDVAIVNTDPSMIWPQSGLSGKTGHLERCFQGHSYT